jgi:hypothetical protein
MNAKWCKLPGNPVSMRQATAGRKRDGFGLNRYRALGLWWSTIPQVKPEGIFPKNRWPPIGSKPEGMVFRIML